MLFLSILHVVKFVDASLFSLFKGILGYDVFLDENGDVQQNLTVMAFGDDIGKKAASRLKKKKTVWFCLSVGLAWYTRLAVIFGCSSKKLQQVLLFTSRWNGV